MVKRTKYETLGVVQEYCLKLQVKTLLHAQSPGMKRDQERVGLLHSRKKRTVTSSTGSLFK